MNWLDVVLIIVLLAAVIRGAELGLVRQFSSTIGFFGGLFLGAWIEGRLIHLAHTPGSRALLSIGVVVGMGLLFLAIGEIIGSLIKHHLTFAWLNRIDGWIGSLTAAVAVLIAVWLGANIFSSIPSPSWQRQLYGSRILSSLNHAMPPAPGVIAKLAHFISPNGFPEVFSGFEPTPGTREVQLPDLGDFTETVKTVAPSVVKIEGRGCGGIVEGSGFIADSNLVITNAHVVAGVRNPEVVDRTGSHRASVIWFDANLDFAVLKTAGLTSPPLAMSSETVDDGTDAVVLGYPGGGDFDAKPAAIIDSFTARGRNIYNEETAIRDIYSMKTTVIAGNSGGPVVDKDGTVIGIVFAQSVAYDEVGYALTMKQAIAEFMQAKEAQTAVSTGNCAE